jgi:hypothetical protein
MRRFRTVHYYTPDGAHPPLAILQEVRIGCARPDRTHRLTVRSALRLCRLLDRLTGQPGVEVGVTGHFTGWVATVVTK